MMNITRWFLTCFVLLSIAGCDRGQTEVAPKAIPVRMNADLELQLMSFNVRYENAEDIEAHAWRQRIRGIVRMLRAQEPDIFGVQEALHGQAADLRASLPDYAFHGVGRDDGKWAGEYSGIFYRADRFEKDDGGTFWLSDTPEKPGSKTWGNEIPRVAAWLRLIDRTTGRGFYVFNTHWDHRNQPSRERAALLIAKRIDSRKHSDEPVVLLGDFNSLEANPGLILLTGGKSPIGERWQNGLLDTFQALHANQKNRRTLHFWSDSTEGNVKVDHILVSQGAKVEDSGIVSQDKPMISDHFPVTAKVLFPSK